VPGTAPRPHRSATVDAAGPFEALGTGCVWGGALAALRLKGGAVFAEPARDAAP